jgi:hypothetical protein
MRRKINRELNNQVMYNIQSNRKMKSFRINLKNVAAIAACLAAAIMFAISCGGNANKKQNANTATEKTAQTETKAEAPKGGTVVVSQTTKPADYTAWVLAKIALLGKTEKDKRVVSTNQWPMDDYVEVAVVEGEGDEWGSSIYHFYYDTERGRNRYNGYDSSYVDEKDDASLWILTRKSGRFSSWQDACDRRKENGDTIVE